MNIRWRRTLFAGVVATLAMTAVGLYVAPLMGIARMNPAEMLAGAMGGSPALGWLAHFMIGVVLAAVYAGAVAKIASPIKGRLLDEPWMCGALFALAPWLISQLAVMPMMGMPVFSGSVSLAAGSLLGHLVYGATLGALYGIPHTRGEAGSGLHLPPVPAPNSAVR